MLTRLQTRIAGGSAAVCRSNGRCQFAARSTTDVVRLRDSYSRYATSFSLRRTVA